jgi:hypothetical protein
LTRNRRFMRHLTTIGLNESTNRSIEFKRETNLTPCKSRVDIGDSRGSEGSGECLFRYRQETITILTANLGLLTGIRPADRPLLELCHDLRALPTGFGLKPPTDIHIPSQSESQVKKDPQYLEFNVQSRYLHNANCPWPEIDVIRNRTHPAEAHAESSRRDSPRSPA